MKTTDPKLKPTNGVLIYFIMGLALGAFLVKKFNPEQKSVVAVTNVANNIEQKKSELINEILTAINLDNDAFSRQILPLIRKEITQLNNPEFNKLADDKFWDALKAGNTNIVSGVKKEYQMLAINFFDQFSTSELQAYLNSKSSLQAKKIQEIMAASRGEFVVSSDELKSEVREMVHKFIQNNPKSEAIAPILDETDNVKQNENVPVAQPEKK